LDAPDARIVRKKGKYPLRAAYRLVLSNDDVFEAFEAFDVEVVWAT